MNKFIAAILSAACGLGAWYVAVFGEKQSFWPSLGCWIAFWMLLSAYRLLENARYEE